MGGGDRKSYKQFLSPDPAVQIAVSAKNKRDEDKAKSQEAIDSAQSDSKKIQKQIETAEEKSLALAQEELDKKRKSQTQTLLFGTVESPQTGRALKKTLG